MMVSPGTVGRRASTSSADRSEEERSLLARYHQRGEESAREALIERFLPLARQLARRYQGSKEPFEDLVQVASVGLIKAVDGFDADRGTAFSSYAVPTILGELKRHFRDKGWAVHVPRALQERALQIESATQSLTRQLGRSPSPGELSEELGMSEEDVVDAIEAIGAHDAVSLDAPRARGEEGETQSHGDTVGSEDERFELIDYQVTIEPALRALPARDRLILHLRFSEDLSQSAIAERVGVSQMHVSRIIRRSLQRLSRAAGSE